MNKKIYITESQFQQYLQEELSIASEVVQISQEILNTILTKLEYSKKFKFTTSTGLDVQVTIYSFDNNKAFSEWLENGGCQYLYNGYSYNNNLITLSGIEINGEIDVTTFENNIFHEIEHYFQTKKQQKSLYNDKYYKITQNINDFNPIVSTVCNILYYTKKIELDAMLHGFYADLKNHDLGRETYNELLKQSELYIVMNKYDSWLNSIEKWTPTPIFNFARKKLYEEGIIKDLKIDYLKKMLIKTINKAKKYVLLKSGKIYSLHKKRHDFKVNNNITENHLELNMWQRIPCRLTTLNDNLILNELNIFFRSNE